jgi:hypothetical protein
MHQLILILCSTALHSPREVSVNTMDRLWKPAAICSLNFCLVSGI